MICLICGKKVLDDSNVETTDPCLECRQKVHHILRIELTIDCNSHHLTKNDGVFIIDSLTKLFIGRGLNLTNIELFQNYEWLDIPMEDIKKLQEQGILK